ncbi:dicarboxylate/amino acid:cation symporter [Clostridium paraputrificum]|uniref:dicarboxylate/amino acid:cation symporter n=1 Tax=Clostridium TaxID=1485 RepID=UPI000C06ADD9|nr:MULTISPECIES: dicarboxylate/amino acid:cation symporter [Clostridium]MDB2074710.1 dicarboxylate/amino acid:cation symporter [Clostridium paraputrificum]MDB2079357.1 dicarboxylate/amino acid:cation symporter [Clostridium paraputrificum]MDB2085331.1 dicarboxylate/amino acid:cation symporter [Clostridium paraputrificum]MDB2099908.1 dicarboxylate/amino acid:cation symporter [Clostridium paraputrificum]MDU1031416.1 dicarboxylate/amino acid:cation symporter [Clostridium sp.]
MKKQNSNKLAIQMAISLILGLVAGTGFILLRENLLSNGNVDLWTSINNLLFQDISAEGAQNALGLFYIAGQLFVNSLQLVIVPMVFTSIALAMCKVSDTKKLGRISYKTILGFLVTSLFALILAGIFGFTANKMGLFNVSIDNLTFQAGNAGSNPLLVIVQAIPNNIAATFTQNGSILAVVFLAVVTGLCINHLGDQIQVLKKLLEDVNNIITVFLSFVITKFGPVAIFVLITRTFAIYGVEHLKPALAYVITTVIALLLFLIFGYAAFVGIAAKLNPIIFVKKISKVALFGFSTSSSAATLPLNTKTTVEELGVSDEIASFTLPLGMTINMNGTAIMQIIAAIFIASSAGYEVTIGNIIVIGLLALIASVGTPAAPGAGAIILFTVLTGMGYNNDAALLAYSLILAINRPVEMLVTSLNVVGDSATAVFVAKSEGMLDEEKYNAI